MKYIIVSKPNHVPICIQNGIDFDLKGYVYEKYIKKTTISGPERKVSDTKNETKGAADADLKMSILKVHIDVVSMASPK